MNEWVISYNAHKKNFHAPSQNTHTHTPHTHSDSLTHSLTITHTHTHLHTHSQLHTHLHTHSQLHTHTHSKAKWEVESHSQTTKKEMCLECGSERTNKSSSLIIIIARRTEEKVRVKKTTHFLHKPPITWFKLRSPYLFLWKKFWRNQYPLLFLKGYGYAHIISD